MNIFKKTSIVLMVLAVCASTLYAADPFQKSHMKKKQVWKVNPYVVYVNHAGQADFPDGSSWRSAYTSLADALNSDLTGKQEIWVTKGIYYPTNDTDRNACFPLVSGISLFGGFQGNEVLRSQRDWNKNPTILSGEIGDPSDMVDNVYHVVIGADDAVMDGFTVQDGYAVLGAGEIDDSGSLVEVPGGSADLEILGIVTNVKSSSGGGLLNVHAGTITRNCRFQNNYASKGGAVYNMITRSWDPGNREATTAGDIPFFQNCIFENNHATGRGGAVNNDFMTSSTFVSCVFMNNSCEAKGGALYADMGSPVYLMNVLFCHNEAERGAALVADGSSPHRMVYTTFIHNMAYDKGAALYQGTYMGEQVHGASFIGNEVHLYRSVVLSNISISSPSSISNWHDSLATFDRESIVETTDGTLSFTEYLDEKSYITKSRKFGFHPNRKVDIDYWTDMFDSDENRLYTAYSYDTMSLTGTPGIIYVDDDAGDDGDGTSWASAYVDLNQALENAVSGSQIWVARGSYVPTDDIDRFAAFVMKEGVAIYGGFSGAETALEERDWETNSTVLSGDIGVAGDGSDNAYHVVFGASDSSLDGFIIRGGMADGEFDQSRGGGLLCDRQASPWIVNCTFESNEADEGGAIACNEYAAPVVENCTISGNRAQSGGGILFRTGPDDRELGAKLLDVELFDNIAEDRGGAVFIDYGAWPSFTRCTLSGNVSNGNGGGVYVDNNSSQLARIEAVFDSCFITGNATGLRGGAFAVYEGRVFLKDTTVTNNIAVSGGGGIALDYMGALINEGDTSVIQDNSSASGEADIDDATTGIFQEPSPVSGQ
jgi:predicted outer membrane repeat protein